MLSNRFYVLSTVFFIYAFLPYLFIYMEENLSFVLFSLLIVVLIFNVYDSILESARLSIFALIARFKILYLYTILNFYFNSIVSFFELSLFINSLPIGRSQLFLFNRTFFFSPSFHTINVLSVSLVLAFVTSLRSFNSFNIFVSNSSLSFSGFSNSLKTNAANVGYLFLL